MRTSKNGKALKLISSAQITLSKIYDAYTINLSNSNLDIVCNDQGDALAGEIGVNGRAITTTSVVMGAKKLTAVASNPIAEQYCISISAQVGCTVAKNGNDKVYVNTLSNSVTGKFSISFNIEGITTVVKEVSFVKKMNDAPNFIDGQFSFGTGYWSNTQDGTGVLGSNVTIKQSNESIYGTNLLEIVNTTAVYSRKTINIEKDKIYRCRFRAKQSIDNTTGNKVAYFGYTPYNSSGTAIGTNGSNNMYFKNEALKTNAWTEWEYYVSTTARAEISTTVNGVKKIITPAVHAFPTNSVKFRPMFIVNYNNGNGIALVDGWILEDATERFEISQLDYKASQIETNVNSINANVISIKTYTDMSSNPMTLAAKANYSEYDYPDQGEVFLHGLNEKRNPANVDGKCIWNAQTVVLPKVMFNPNTVVPDGMPVYMVRNIADNKWWSIWKEESGSTTIWKRALANVNTSATVYTHTWNETNDIVVGYYIIKKTTPRVSDAPIITAQLFEGALNYKQATSMTLVGSISQLEILENEVNLKVANTDNKVSQLKLEADKITQRVQSTETKVTTVTNDLNNLQIGGKNLLLNSSFTKNKDNWSGSGVIVTEDNKSCTKITGSLKQTYYVQQSILNKVVPNQQYTVSGWVKVKNITFGSTNPTLMFYVDGEYNNNGNVTWYGYGAKYFDRSVTEWQYVTWTFTTDNKLKTANSCYFFVYCRDFTGDVFFYNLKLEKGNKATDWSPAPEDTDNAINNIQIGGRNLMRYSSPELLNNLNIADKWQTGRCTLKADYSGDNHVFDGKKAYWIIVTNEKDGWAQLKVPEERLVIEPNSDYTISFKSQIGANCKGMRLVLFNSGDSKSQEIYRKTKDGTTEWIKNHDKVTFKNTLNEKAYLCIYNMGKVDTTSGSYDSNLLMRDIQIEKGNKVSDWTPAPEDIDNAISNVNSKVESTKNKVAEITTSLDSINLKVQSTEQTVINHTSQLNQVDNKISNAVDNIQIGGRNLALGTGKANGDVSAGHNGSPYVATDLLGGITAIKTNTEWSGRYFNLKAIAQRGGFKVGDNLVLSVYIKSDQNVTLNVTSHRTTSTGNTPGSSKAYNNFTVTPKWQQVWFPFVADEGSLDRTVTRIEVNKATGTNYIHWAGWKLEKGTKPTDWAPAPEDINNAIDDIQIGGRNYIIPSKVEAYSTYASAVSNNFNGWTVTKKNYTSNLVALKQNGYAPEVGKTYTMSGYAELNGTPITNAFFPTKKLNTYMSELGIFEVTNGYFKITQKWTTDNSWIVHTDFNVKTGDVIVFKNLKFEEGNRATSWTPATETIQAAIDSKANATDVYTKTETYTQAQVNSQIKLAKDEITLGVSNTYETKTNVTSKINTAKTEAINSASADTTNQINSAKNELNTTINNITIGGRNLFNIKNYVHYAAYSTLISLTQRRLELKAVNANGYIAFRCEGYILKGIHTISGKLSINGVAVTSNILKQNSINRDGTIQESKFNSDGTFYIIVNYTGKTSWFVDDAFNVKVNDIIVFEDLKFEQGNKPTAWTPAHEDVTAAIDLKASKNDVYTKSEVYTKSQADSAIKIAKDEINLSVSQNYETKTNVENKITNAVNNVQVGGRNYVLKSDTYITGNNNKNFDYGILQELRGKTITVSIEIDLNAAKGSRVGFEPSIVYTDGSEQYIGVWQSISSATTAKKRISATHTIQDKEIKWYNQRGIYIQGVTSGTARIGRPKLEIGTKATDWTSAPEDIDNAITTVQNQVTTTNNKMATIETNLNGITQRVSSTENTVSSHTTQLGTVDNRINTAKNAAISTAASDATTKANNAQNKALADAKNYTNGQVTTVTETLNSRVAEIKATTDSITQKVSATETKVNTVTTNLNNLQIGGRNYIIASKVDCYSPYNTINTSTSGYIKSTWKATNTWNTFTINVTGFTPKKTIYTISGIVKVNGSIPTAKYFTGYASTYGSNLIRNDYDATTGKFVITQSYPGNSVWIFHGQTTRSSGSTDVVELFNLQFEEGNKATDWTPAPEDVTSAINNVDSKVESTKNRVAEIATSLDSINLKVQSTEQTVSNHATQLGQVDNKINNAQNTAINSSKGYTDGQITTVNKSVADKVAAINLTTDSITQRVASTESKLTSTITIANNANNKIDNLSIGGRNLFKGYTDKEFTLNNYQNTGSFTQFRQNLTFDPADYLNKEFTISFYAKSPNGQTELQIYNANESPRYFYFRKTLDTNLNTEWKYYTYTFTNTDRGSSAIVSNKIEIYAPNKMGVLVKKIKIELGNKASDWTPAPEDIQTSIDAKANSIDVYNKSEVYTKTQADSAIKVAKDAIELGVKNTYETKSNVENKITNAVNNIQVGGRNYIIPSKVEAYSTYASAVSNNFNGWTVTKKNHTSNIVALKQNGYAPEVGKTYTMSGYAELNGTPITDTFFPIKKLNTYMSELGIFEINNGYFKITQKWTNENSWIFHTNFNVNTGDVIVFKNLKFEEGNRATSWTPATETVQAAIDSKANATDVYTKTETYTQAQVNSQIKIAKDEINLGVSNTYETKTNVTSKITTAKTEAVNTSKNYADTKKSEAITAAANDAASKVNAAKSELNTAIGKKANSTDVYTKSEVYTKAQADSAIKVAKDNIELGVKNTYETKSNVESKITNAVDNIQIGGRNLFNIKNYVHYAAYSTLISLTQRRLELKAVNVNGYIAFRCEGYIPKGIHTLSGKISINGTAITSNIFKHNTLNQSGGTIQESKFNSDGTFYAVANYAGKSVWMVDCAFNVKANDIIVFEDLKFEQGNKSTTWTPAPEDIDHAITTVQNQVTTTSNKMATIETNLNGITQRVSSTESTISTHTTQLGTVDSRINTAKNSAINTAASDATTKANNAQNKALADAKNYTNGQVTTVTETLNSRVAEIKATTDSITQKVSATETKVNTVTTNLNNLQIGGRNYVIANKVDCYSPYNTINTSTPGYIKSTWNANNTWDTFTIKINGFNPKKAIYTMSGIVKVNGAIPTSKYFTGYASTYGNNLIKNDYDAATGKFVITQSYPGNSVWIFHATTTRTSKSTDVVELFNLKFEEGNKATDWSPAPEDVTNAINNVDSKLESTKNQVASIETNLSGITQRVSNTETTTTSLQNTMNNVTSPHGLAYAKDLVIYGESNKYYPVYFKNGNQNVLRTIKIWRSYSEQAPNDWYTSTHKGALMLTWQGNFGGWGGASYKDKIVDYSHNYTTLLADCYITMHSMAYVFFLRGGGSGGAIYHFASDQSFTPEVYYNGSQDLVYNHTNDAYKVYAANPLTAVNAARINGLMTAKESSVTTVKNQVAEIATNLNSINLKVQSTEQTVTNHTTQLGQVDNKINNAINNVQVGGRNLVQKSNDANTYGTENGIAVSKANNFIKVLKNTSSTNSNLGTWKDIVVEPNTEYTVSLQVGHSDSGKIGIGSFISGNNMWSQYGYFNFTANKLFTKTFVTKNQETKIRLFIAISNNMPINSYVEFINLKLEKGNKATDWTPAPEDISSSIANVDTKVNSSMSQIEMLTNKIGLKVDKNNVIASINLYTQENESGTSSGVKISGDKIDLQGQVTFSSLADSNVSGSIKNIFTQQNNQTVINGGMIKTQTIKGNDLLLKGNLTVTDSSSNKTFEITSNGDVNIQAKSLRIGSANVATNNDVNTAINNLQVGGRNYVLKSDAYITGNNNKNFDYGILQELRGKTITVSIEIDLNAAKGSRVGFEPSIVYTDGSEQYIGVWQSISSATTAKKRISATHTIQDKEIKWYNQRGMYIQGVTSGTARIGRPKLEIGTKATDWTSAPEDTVAAINSKVDNTQEAIFNKLFANGQQGFVLEGGKVYINGEVIKANVISGTAIKAGTLDASKIKAGIIQASAGGSYLNLNDGSMMLGTRSLSNYLQWTGSQLNIKANSISIGSSAIATTTDVTNAINNIQIGGRNYIIASKVSCYSSYNTINTSTPGYIKSTWNANWTGNVFTINITGFTPKKAVYTVSGIIKVNGSIPAAKYFTGYASTYGSNLIRNDYDATTGKFIITQSYPGNSSWIFHGQTTRTSGSTDVVELFNLQFEEGNTVTDWNPASEDKVDNNQEAIFNKLFSNGQQGFVLENGKVYINGEVIKANALKGSVISAINMSTEYAKINSANIGNIDASKITTGFISANRLDASTLVSKINGGYTSISGNKIRTGIIRANSGGSYIDLDDGTMQLGTTSKSNYLQWNGSTLKIKGHLDTCTFRGKNMVYIEDNGILSCDGDTYIRHLSVLETHPGWAYGTRGSFDCAPTANFKKEVRTEGEFWARNNSGEFLGVIRRGAYKSGVIQIDRMRVINEKHGSANNYVEVACYNSNHVFGIDLWSSDEKLKENIVSIEDNNASLLNDDTSKTGLNLINNLNHYAYDYKKSFGGDHVTCGYVAQELQELNDSLVMEIEQQDGTTLLQPKASNIIPNLSLAIKQQQKMIEDLKAEIELLKSKLNN